MSQHEENERYDFDEEFEEDTCEHERTILAEDSEPYDRLCSDC